MLVGNLETILLFEVLLYLLLDHESSLLESFECDNLIRVQFIIDSINLAKHLVDCAELHDHLALFDGVTVGKHISHHARLFPFALEFAVTVDSVHLLTQT